MKKLLLIICLLIMPGTLLAEHTATSSSGGGLSDNSILEVYLKAINAPGDEECLTYEVTVGDFEWQTCGVGTGAFSDAGDPIVQNTITKDVHIGDGAGTLAGKLEIGGDADQPQLVIEGFSTQTDDIFIIQNDADTEVFGIGNTGNVVSAGNRIQLGDANSYWDFNTAIANSNIIAFDAFDYLEYDRVDNAYRFHIGAAPNPDVEFADDLFSFQSDSVAALRGLLHGQHSDTADGARFNLRKSRGTKTSPTTVVTGDVLGNFLGYGYDGANYLAMGSIQIKSVGTIAATRVPTEVSIHTATDAEPSVLTERLKVGPSGILTQIADSTGTAQTVLPAGAIDSTEILDDAILEIDLKAVDAAVDEECLTYEATGGDFEWQSCGGGAMTDAGAFVHPNNDGDSIRARDAAAPTTKYVDIKHDGTNSVIEGVTGNLRINSTTDFVDIDDFLRFRTHTSSNVIDGINNTNVLTFRFDGADFFHLDQVNLQVRAAGDGNTDIGTVALPFKDGHFGGKLYAAAIHTNATNYQRGFFDCNSTTDVCTLGTEFQDGSTGGEEVASAVAFAPGAGKSVRITTTGSKPTCDSTTRTGIFYVQGAGGVADSVEICMKDAADAYAWKVLATP